MAGLSLEERYIDEGREVLDHLAADGVDISAALWAHDAENDRWSRCIVSSFADEHGDRAGFRRVFEALDALEAMKSRWLEWSDIRVVGLDSPLAGDAVGMYGGFPPEKPTRYYGPSLGGIVVDQAYLYRQPVPH